MEYGTFDSSDGSGNKCGQMTCFKLLFYQCCFCFKKKTPTVRRSRGTRSSDSSSENEGGDVSSRLSSPKSVENDQPVSLSQLTKYDFADTVDEDGKNAPSQPESRTRTPSCESEKPKVEGIQVPLISVTDFREGEIKEDSKMGKNENNPDAPDSDVDQLPAYNSRSQLSLSLEHIRDDCTTDVASGSAEDEDYDSVKVNGDILFGLSYNYKNGSLEVHVKECRNLSPVDSKRNRSDPYVKAYLLPERSKNSKRKTKIKRQTLNPIFEEILKFPVSISELDRRTLWMSVWHSHIGRNNFLGEIMVPLGHGIVENYGYKRFPLKERTKKNTPSLKYNGDLVVALKFVPLSASPHDQDVPEDQIKGDLHVLVKEGKNLIPAYANGTSNPFCKSYLLPDRNKASKQKTPVIKKSCNPKWNYTFVYNDVSLSDLRERSLELTLWSQEKISNTFLGGVRLNLGKGRHKDCTEEWMDSVGEELNLWQAMLLRPDTFVEGSILMRSQMLGIQTR